ncbi:hypothetical protein PR048_002379 [Dryococelus australis]|uniref:Uncharacterized protein n=1 Tax=Dryococelus australis TaxID=614101 RepID=A0ABQ9IK07_9NEOP|nr:hypothetical protein PR048_002379 [Dryococelus australis]
MKSLRIQGRVMNSQQENAKELIQDLLLEGNEGGFTPVNHNTTHQPRGYSQSQHSSGRVWGTTNHNTPLVGGRRMGEWWGEGGEEVEKGRDYELPGRPQSDKSRGINLPRTVLEHDLWSHGAATTLPLPNNLPHTTGPRCRGTKSAFPHARATRCVSSASSHAHLRRAALYRDETAVILQPPALASKMSGVQFANQPAPGNLLASRQPGQWVTLSRSAVTNQECRARSQSLVQPIRGQTTRLPSRRAEFDSRQVARMWESCRTMPLIGAFFRVSDTPPPASFSPRSTFIASQDHNVNSRPILSTHSLTNSPIAKATDCAVCRGGPCLMRNQRIDLSSMETQIRSSGRQESFHVFRQGLLSPAGPVPEPAANQKSLQHTDVEGRAVWTGLRERRSSQWESVQGRERQLDEEPVEIWAEGSVCETGASQKQFSDTHKTPYDRVKRCRERKINTEASERVNRRGWLPYVPLCPGDRWLRRAGWDEGRGRGCILFGTSVPCRERDARLRDARTRRPPPNPLTPLLNTPIQTNSIFCPPPLWYSHLLPIIPHCPSPPEAYAPRVAVIARDIAIAQCVAADFLRLTAMKGFVILSRIINGDQ